MNMRRFGQSLLSPGMPRTMALKAGGFLFKSSKSRLKNSGPEAVVERTFLQALTGADVDVEARAACGGASDALDTLVTAEVQVADYDGSRPGEGE